MFKSVLEYWKVQSFKSTFINLFYKIKLNNKKYIVIKPYVTNFKDWNEEIKWEV